MARYKFCPICGTLLRPVPVSDEAATPVAAAAPTLTAKAPDKGHLFETVEKKTESSRRYLKLFAVVVIVVIVVGLAISYLTLPGVGDKVLAPTGMEMAIRDHFLTTEKRTAADIEIYYCGEFYWSRVGVETRTDMPNPLLRVGTYAARAAPAGESAWKITAAPITSPEMNEPCR